MLIMFIINKVKASFKMLFMKDPCKKCLVFPCCDDPCDAYLNYFDQCAGKDFSEFPYRNSLKSLRDLASPLTNKLIILLIVYSVCMILFKIVIKLLPLGVVV